MSVVEITFPEADLATAGQLAQSVRAAAIEAGLPPAEATVRKENPETMDPGSILTFIQQGVDAVRPFIDLGMLSMAVYGIVFREKCVMKIKTPNGEVRIGPGTMTVAQIKTVLAESLRGTSSKTKR